MVGHEITPALGLQPRAALQALPRVRVPPSEMRQLCLLAAPIAATNLVQAAGALIETLVAGRLSPAALGAVGLGNSLFLSAAILGAGVTLGLDPLICQAVGARQHESARDLLGQGFWLAGLICLPLLLLLAGFAATLAPLGVGSETVALTRSYLWLRSVGLFAYLAVVALRSYVQAALPARLVTQSVAVALLLQLPAAWLLGLGDAGLTALGIPGLGFAGFGVAGIAAASSLALVMQAVFLLGVIAWRRMLPVHFDLRLSSVIRASRLGFPVGAAMLGEYAIFAIVAVLAGTFGETALASHQVAISLAGSSFVLPLGIGSAAAVCVGRAVGSGATDAAHRFGRAGMWLAASCMLAVSVVFWLSPRLLAGMVCSAGPAVIDAAVPLLLVAGLFQLSDGVQAAAAGALRGAGDTASPLIAVLVGHYGIGLPVGLVAAFGLGLGTSGLWLGLTAGLTFVAVSLWRRFPASVAPPGLEPSARESLAA